MPGVGGGGWGVQGRVSRVNSGGCTSGERKVREVPKMSPGSRSVESDSGIVWCLSETKITVSGRRSSGEYVDHIIPGKRWSARLAHQVDLGEFRRGGKRSSFGAGKSKVVDVVGVAVIGNKIRGSVGIVMVQGEIATGWLGELVRQRGLSRDRGTRTSLEAPPAASPHQGNGVLHSSGRNDASPHC